MSPSDSLDATFSSFHVAQDEPPFIDVSSSNWRSQLQPEARQRIVNRTMDTLRRHSPVVASKGTTKLKKTAVGFEEKIYAAAVNHVCDSRFAHIVRADQVDRPGRSVQKFVPEFVQKFQSDYLRKISLKLLSMESKTQQNIPTNPLPGINQNSTDAGVVGEAGNSHGGATSEEPAAAATTKEVA